MKRSLILIFILIATMLLGACKNNNETSDDDGTVNIYYIDTKTAGIVSESYELIGTETEDQIDELLYMLKKGPNNPIYKSSLPENVTMKEFVFNEDGSMTINFDSSYSELTGIPEVLARATIVKTLSQIDGVEYIQFNVNGIPLVDSNGEYVGLMTAEDFIDSTGANTNYKVKLYFANEKGDALKEYITDINYTGNGTMEELVINQLINGPVEIGMYDTIPEGTILLDVTTQEGICTVDFNEKFLEKLENIKNDEIVIYSVVNSLVELPDVNKVQFKINGTVQKTYREGITFDGQFDRSLNLTEDAN